MAIIKNKAVDIKIGKKSYNFTNLIMDKLLNTYANSLIDDYKNLNKGMLQCLISFQTMNITPEQELKSSAFDIAIVNSNYSVTSSEQKIITKSVCDTENTYIYDYAKKTANNIKISDYAGNKICYLGFSYVIHPNAYVLATLDVSNYDIYIQDNEEIVVTRIDEISTDAIFISLSDKINAPVHLLPRAIDGILPAQEFWSGDQEVTIYNKAFAKLTNFRVIQFCQ